MAGFITKRRYMRLSPLQRLRKETSYYAEKKPRNIQQIIDPGEIEFFTKVREKSIGAK
jgi:hypothetical protein